MLGRSHILTLLMVCAFAFACEKGEYGNVVEPGDGVPLSSRAKFSAILKLKEKHPDLVDIRVVSVHETEKKYGIELIFADGKTRRLDTLETNIDVVMEPQGAWVDVVVDPSYRGYGLGRLLETTALERENFPQITSGLFGTNKSALTVAMTENLHGQPLMERTRQVGNVESQKELAQKFVGLTEKLNGPEAVVEFRNHVIESVMSDTPAGRNASQMGYGLKDVIISVKVVDFEMPKIFLFNMRPIYEVEVSVVFARPEQMNRESNVYITADLSGVHNRNDAITFRRLKPDGTTESGRGYWEAVQNAGQ